MLSIVIPSRNEIYLPRTVEDILDKARGDIEVIVMIEGEWPDKPLREDKRVIIMRHAEPIGQRACVNKGMKIARGKYMLKCDGHTMFDEGFDVKLPKDCEYDWTVIPRMYNLDPEVWQPKWHKYSDFMWIRSPKDKKKPFRHNYYDGTCAREFPDMYRAYKKAPWRTGDICDCMTAQGACWFMHTDRFWELGGMDEGHGSWGQVGVEMSLKAWLSGGRHIVNKKTWFAHWFRGGGGPGFPYKIRGSDQEKARRYSRELWLSGKWPLQKRSIKWLVEKFSPLPHWDKYFEANKTSDKIHTEPPRR